MELKFLVGRNFSQTPKIYSISTDFIFTDKVYYGRRFLGEATKERMRNINQPQGMPMDPRGTPVQFQAAETPIFFFHRDGCWRVGWTGLKFILVKIFAGIEKRKRRRISKSVVVRNK